MPRPPLAHPSRSWPLASDRRRFIECAVGLGAVSWLGLASGCASAPGATPGPAKAAAGVGRPMPTRSELSAHDLALVDRLSWGASAGTASDFDRAGRAAWLQGQLHPGRAPGLPAQAQALIDAMSISRTAFEPLVAELDASRRDSEVRARAASDDAARQAARRVYAQALARVAREAASRSLLRALYSPHQLQEQMTWFWFNHFNVYADKSWYAGCFVWKWFAYVPKGEARRGNGFSPQGRAAMSVLRKEFKGR